MAIAPTDPRHPDLTASDILSPQTWPRRGSARPTVGLDVICTKIAVDFQTMTAATALDTIIVNLELLREATRVDTAFHVALDPELAIIGDVQVARGMLATGNPEQLRGKSLDEVPWLQSRLAPVRVSELRDTCARRRDQARCGARDNQPRQGPGRRQGPLSAPAGRGAGPHRARASRRGAVSRKRKRPA